MAAYTLPKLCQNMACFAYMIDEAKYLMDIGNNIRTRRNDLGVSQQELADNSDIAKSTVQRIEKGELNPTIIVLQKVSKALDMGLCELLPK